MTISKTLTSIIDYFYLPPFKRVIPLRTFRYSACGGLNLVLDACWYFIILHYIVDKEFIDLGFVVISPHIASLIIVFPITFLTGFWLNRNVAFKQSPLRGRVQLTRYMIQVTGSLLLNYILMKILVEYCAIYPTVSKILTNIIVTGYSYMMQKRFTFKGSATV